MAFFANYLFDDPNDYTFNSTKIKIENNDTSLKLIDNPGQDFPLTFDNDTGFTYDNTKAEFVGGALRQKDQRPTNSIVAATFTNSLNASWAADGFVSLAATLNGTPTNVNGKLVCTGTQGLSYSDSIIGALSGDWAAKFEYTPNYTTSPLTNVNIFSISQAVGGTDDVIIFNSPSGNNLRISANGLSAVVLGGWTPVAGTSYVFEVHCVSNQVSLFVDNVQIGSAQTIIPAQGTTANLVHLGAYSGTYNTAEGSFDNFILYSVTGQTPTYTIPEYSYLASIVTTPELEYTGVGTLISFDAFSTTETGTPRYTIQVGRSGNYLYWNGSAWVTSNDDYSQATTETVFDANSLDIDVNGQIYGQYKIHFENTNTQSSVNYMLSSLTAQIYPTDNPTIEGITRFEQDEILSFSVVQLLSGSDNVKFVILGENGSWYYWTGTAWAVSDETYTQSSVFADIAANITTLNASTTESTFRAFLHSDDGSTTPVLSSVIFKYNFLRFVVEDGTGKSNSTSYVTVDEFRNYWLDRGANYDSTSDMTIKGWLNRGTQQLNNNNNFKGFQTVENQSLQWPRTEMDYDNYSYRNRLSFSGNTNEWAVYDDRTNQYIDINEVPESVKLATYEQAQYAATKTKLNEDPTNLSQKRIGPITKSFADKGSNVSVYREVDAYLNGLIAEKRILRE